MRRSFENHIDPTCRRTSIVPNFDEIKCSMKRYMSYAVRLIKRYQQVDSSRLKCNKHSESAERLNYLSIEIECLRQRSEIICSFEQLTHSWWVHPDRFARSFVSLCIVIVIVAFTFSPRMFFCILLFFCSYFRSLSVGHEKRTFHEKKKNKLFGFVMHLRSCHTL